MQYPNMICRVTLTILIIAALFFGYAAADELGQEAAKMTLEKYEKWKTEAGTRTAVVAGGQTITLVWSETSPEQWKALRPDETDLILK